jgi:biopolymer transport protein ExbD
MGGVNVDGGGKGGRRSVDTEINMIPMIDLLMVTISFLLITAVWVQSSRIDANANVPGPATDVPPCTDASGAPCKPEARLHVQSTDPSKFVLVWKEGATVVRTAEVPREASRTKIGKDGKAIVAFPALAARINEEWKAAGVHRDPTDKKFDKAVVHAGNDMPYGEIVAVMDAVSQPKRSIGTSPGRAAQAAAFEMTFATD